MTEYIDHGDSHGPWPLSEGVDPTLGRGYKGKSMGTGHEVYNRQRMEFVPLETEIGMDLGLFSPLP